MRKAERVRLEDGFWSAAATRAALGGRDFEALFRLVLAHAGVSQTQLGIECGISQSEVSQIVRGVRRVEQFSVVERIAVGLGMPDHARLALGLAPVAQDGVGAGCDQEDDVDRRRFVVAGLATGAAVAGAAGSGGRVSAAALRPDGTTADYLRSLVQAMRELDDTAPTGSLVGASAQLLGLAQRCVAEARHREQREVGRATAEIAMAHWWMKVDAGHDASAEHARAVALAVEWELPELVGHLLGWRAGVALADGDLAGCVRLARSAREARWATSPGGVAQSAAYEARAHALVGDDDGLAAALDVLDGALEALDPNEEPPWLYWMRDERLTLFSLDVRLLRDGPGAAVALERELAGLPADMVKDAAWYRADIAAARARAGDIEGAAQDAALAARLSMDCGSTWNMAEVAQLAEAPHLARVREALSDSGFPAALTRRS